MYDYYDLLGVDRHADTDTIEAAFRERIRESHPDRDESTATEEVVRVQRARDVLTDPALRKDYDRLGHRKFLQRERGAGSDDIELRSTENDGSRSAHPRSHTRPRSDKAGRADTASGRSRRRSARSATTEEPTAGESQPATSTEQTPTSRSDPEGREESPDADRPTEPNDNGSGPEGDVDIPEDFPTNVDMDGVQNGTLCADDLESVVEIDDLLEETNVGSVDPNKLLSETDSNETADDETTSPVQSDSGDEDTEIESVVALDDLLEETNVGSVDPKQLFSGSSSRSPSHDGTTDDSSGDGEESSPTRRLRKNRNER